MDDADPSALEGWLLDRDRTFLKIARESAAKILIHRVDLCRQPLPVD